MDQALIALLVMTIGEATHCSVIKDSDARFKCYETAATTIQRHFKTPEQIILDRLKAPPPKPQ